MISKLTVLFLVIAVSSCGSSHDPKDSIVIFDGMIKKDHKVDKNLISRLLTGDEGPYQAKATVSTSVVFSQKDGDDEIILDCGDARWLCPEGPYKVGFAHPGNYELTNFRIGNHIIEYDEEKCGEIGFTLNPDEILYIGGVRPPEGVDLFDKYYASYRPVFEDRKNFDYKKAIGRYYGKYDKEELDLALTKKFTKELPKYKVKDIPPTCIEVARPIWERI